MTEMQERAKRGRTSTLCLQCGQSSLWAVLLGHGWLALSGLAPARHSCHRWLSLPSKNEKAKTAGLKAAAPDVVPRHGTAAGRTGKPSRVTWVCRQRLPSCGQCRASVRVQGGSAQQGERREWGEGRGLEMEGQDSALPTPLLPSVLPPRKVSGLTAPPWSVRCPYSQLPIPVAFWV